MPDQNRTPSASRQWLARLAPVFAPVLGGVIRHPSMLERMLTGVLSHLKHGRLTLVLPDGRSLNFDGVDHLDLHAVLHVRDWRAIRKMITGGDVGFAESYIDGEWKSPDLTALMRVAALNEAIVRARFAGGVLSRLIGRIKHLRNANSLDGSKRNIAYHYDLGNSFYDKWLDPGMTYSSALYSGAGQSLEAAQDTKYSRICELADLRPGDRILEVGCGWGGFAERAAGQYGGIVECLTLSREQHAYAQNRMLTKGLADRTHIALRDYREQDGQFDKLVSIEMFEAVGEEHWPTYFAMIRDRLKPGGKAVLQIITIDNDRFESYRSGADFIQRYIFPGGMLPSPDALARAIAKAGLELTHSEYFGPSYATTLQEWQRRFQHGWDDIARQGFDLRFKRMWEYYLSYCETGFIEGSINVGFFVIEHPENS
ncbi:cyclopropane-fatty-acyl-phospholipid synthase family protein [Thalassospira sp.]|uniref:SAM-dependent methyltransferase n=1 Tax=Thalassospira sp. TaxID=1912094 RepID=UPI0027364724|nr:cyclopropane-fatty-acyl-phospholipid synthase family protein [Thalassospira sp.]MDP2699460.1 cyclopropane-fatty-acyl-phospholipid synthase family protein [Thalassospira sp.]